MPITITCGRCGASVEAKRRTRKWCDACKTRPAVGLPPAQRVCRYCQGVFEVPRPAPYGERSRAYCTSECARSAKRVMMRESKRRLAAGAPRSHVGRPRVLTDEERAARGSKVKRWFVKHPHRPAVCEACGEDRVVELAHKVPRNGVPMRDSNTRDEDVWVLCPTCHKVLDYGISTPAELGLS